MQRKAIKPVFRVGSPRYAGFKHATNTLAPHLPIALFALTLNEKS